MASLGKRILSAFVEVTEEEKAAVTKAPATQVYATASPGSTPVQQIQESKFKVYFDKLFSEANIPGPDYFEFSKMTEAMRSIPDEKARYAAAFAGLNVQGLDKQKLLLTAAQYIEVLDNDAASFNSTVDAALQEKVIAKQQEIETMEQRIHDISKELTDLQNKITVLRNEIRENEEKIESNSGSYKTALELMKQKIGYDITKIREHIQE